jgi:hypothetical protein
LHFFRRNQQWKLNYNCSDLTMESSSLFTLDNPSTSCRSYRNFYSSEKDSFF